jgi:hypothetical protein
MVMPVAGGFRSHGLGLGIAGAAEASISEAVRKDSLSLRERVGVRGSWQRLRRAAKKDVETLLPNPLTLTLSRRERGPEVTHFRIATQILNPEPSSHPPRMAAQSDATASWTAPE